jgi:hypothetical protein
MKKILLLLVGVILISSCTLSKEDELPKDCGCNRIVEISSFYMPDRSVFGTYITINDCTGIQRQSTWKYSHDKPQKGDCR